MKAIKKIPIFLLTMMLCIGMMALPAFAASSTQDGLEVTLTTDKATYSQGEQIVATLTVTNTNEVAVSNVSLENVVPEGYKLADGSEATKLVESLGAGGTVTLTVTYVPDTTSGSETDPGNSNTGDGNNSENDGFSNQNGDQSNTGETDSTSNSPKAGDNSNIAFWIVLLVSAGAGIVIILALQSKQKKRLLSLFLCVAMVGTMAVGMSAPAKAAELQGSISLYELVTVNNASLNINATVKYYITQKTDDEAEKPTMPDNPSEADEYYFNHSEVIDVIDAKESQNTLSETEAIHIFEERGFNDYPVLCEYSMDGEYDSQAEAADGSENKHPMYQTFYVSESGDVWTIYVINGDIFAYPASFNLESDLYEVVIISESEHLTSYDNETNNFYVTIPSKSEVILKNVNRIDAETLDRLTSEEVSKL